MSFKSMYYIMRKTYIIVRTNICTVKKNMYKV